MQSQHNTSQILSDLIGFASISSTSNLDIVDYIESCFRQHAVSVRRILDPSGAKASLLATIGPADRPGVVLSAHTDVVPVDGQAWSSPPFQATRRDGRVVGRGATDMKGFIACVLAQLGAFKQIATETPVHIALSYDEEVGCRGAPDLVAAVAALPARPALCIVGEPTGLSVVRAHKGKLARRVAVRGRGGHSALPHRAANAVVAAARIVASLATHAERLQRDPPQDPTFDPPWSTLHVGSLHGGSALNLVPDRALLEFEIRALPGTDTAALMAETDREIDRVRAALKREAAEAEVTVEEIVAYPALSRAANAAVAELVGRLSGREAPGGTASFGTEAGLYAAAGIPTVVCGPGDIARAHKADEWIGFDELAAADRMLARLAALLARPIAEWMPVHAGP